MSRFTETGPLAHFNFFTMHGYNAGDIRKGYNPFDNPDDWEFFLHPFVFEEGNDILSDYVFQIRKLTRRLHTWFDPITERPQLETGYYLSLLDAATETEDYIIGAHKYARLCRMEKTLYLMGTRELKDFFDNYKPAYENLLLELKRYAHSDDINENLAELDGTGDYVSFSQWQYMVQNAPGGKLLKNILLNPEINAAHANAELFMEGLEKFDIHGYCDTSCYESLVSGIDIMLFNIRGTLLLYAFYKIYTINSELEKFEGRHDKLQEKLCSDVYDELLANYARSGCFRQFRDVKLKQRCITELALRGCKPTAEQIDSYFNNQFRTYVNQFNTIQKIFLKNNEDKVQLGNALINAISDKDRYSEAEEFLFLMSYSEELAKCKYKITQSKLPEGLDTPEASLLLKKARKAGLLDERWQPRGEYKMSKRKASVLAFVIGCELGLNPLWSPFEILWQRKNMRIDYNGATTTEYYNDLEKKILRIIR